MWCVDGVGRAGVRDLVGIWPRAVSSTLNQRSDSLGVDLTKSPNVFGRLLGLHCGSRVCLVDTLDCNIKLYSRVSSSTED